jgi:hypothetical protein
VTDLSPEPVYVPEERPMRNQRTDGDYVYLTTPWPVRLLFSLPGAFFLFALVFNLSPALVGADGYRRGADQEWVPTWAEYTVFGILLLVGLYGLSVAWRSELRLGPDDIAKRRPLGRWRTLRREDLTAVHVETKGSAIGPTWPTVHVHLRARTSDGERRMFVSSDTTSLGPVLDLCQEWTQERPHTIADERTRRLLSSWERKDRQPPKQA